MNQEPRTNNQQLPPMEQSPLVSVVIPTYNRAELICDALESIKDQTYRPLEIIVVDDGSTDGTESTIKNWIKSVKVGEQSAPGLSLRAEKEKQVSEGETSTYHLNSQLVLRFVKQQNLGGNAARNNGIRNATGAYIAFLDSDDKWHAEKLRKQLAIFDREVAVEENSLSLRDGRDPDVADSTSGLNSHGPRPVGAVYCGLQCWFPEEGDRIEAPAPRDYPAGNILNKMLVHDVTSPTSCYLVRADVFEEVGIFDEELQARQDWDMWIRVASTYQVHAVPEVLVDFREHSGIRTASNPWKEINAYKSIMQKYAALRAQAPFSVRRKAWASFYRRLGRVHFHQKISTPKAFGYQVLAILNGPFTFDSYAALFGMLLPRDGRQALHRAWNRVFGGTALAIRSH